MRSLKLLSRCKQEYCGCTKPNDEDWLRNCDSEQRNCDSERHNCDSERCNS